jgi:hypothetical protein
MVFGRTCWEVKVPIEAYLEAHFEAYEALVEAYEALVEA